MGHYSVSPRFEPNPNAYMLYEYKVTHSFTLNDVFKICTHKIYNKLHGSFYHMARNQKHPRCEYYTYILIIKQTSKLCELNTIVEVPNLVKTISNEAKMS